jgi:conjugal transfer pilus assembly protein TraE
VELDARSRSIAEVQQRNRVLGWVVAGLTLTLLLMSVRLVTQSQIVIQQIPGMPASTVIEKSAMDKGGQMAILATVTATIAQVNPSNKEFMKRLLQVFLSAKAYTPVSQEIDRMVRQLEVQRELGSYYFVQRAYSYDPVLDKHFVIGDVHTVNAAHDSAVSYVYEYRVHVENYRLVVDELIRYEGEKPHDSQWLKANQR